MKIKFKGESLADSDLQIRGGGGRAVIQTLRKRGATLV